ncbi:hypothetical protein PIB30_048944 [Stylosanthes scabra]|uniref:Protein FAR1-RELATED SEQUENCE n=1 Tax=Stylosanthes scabra TaxID=79078 RepID=A0ABU6ZFX9_9FABA|nr:hypothetical protein [Stylosanthes scabra]
MEGWWWKYYSPPTSNYRNFQSGAPTAAPFVAMRSFSPSSILFEQSGTSEAYVDTYVFERGNQLITSFTLIKFLSFVVMYNSSKKSKEEVDDTHDLSFDYKCSSDESDDMTNVDVNMLEGNVINIDGEEKLLTNLTTEDIWGLVFDSESEVCDFYARYASYHGFVSRKNFRSVDFNDNINIIQLVCNKA